ncbi:MAG TPA: response regulator transcription factor [Candidatus Angelobacter sp.]|nr:response regulator transcription factor [Candidatus Angelobacter sp.]
MAAAKKKIEASAERIRVLIADDYPVVREGLASVVNRQPDMQVVAEAQDGRAAVEQFLLHRPDVALLDLRMPHLDGVAALQEILAQVPEARIILLSACEGDENIYQGLRAGAKGYLVKDSPVAELLESVRKVHSGLTYILPTIAAKLALRITRPTLSDRELEVLQCMAAGKSNKEIGTALYISEGTVKVHVSNLMRKLQATGRTEAVNLALMHGMVHVRRMSP